jgi:hypothetical protein
MQYAPSHTPPPQCTICEEERQFVPPTGQGWITLEDMAVRHVNSFKQYESGIFGIGSQPRFAIGQQALLICTPHGNVLWDCIALIDDATVSVIKALGGIQAFGISHPHFYTTMVEWSRAFGNVPVHLHAADRKWIMRPDAALKLWDGDTIELLPGATMIRSGGHFRGAAMLHWAGGAGVLCCSDIATIVQDRKLFTFMRSYPNLIPLSAREVEGISAALAPFAFDRAYGHYFDRVIASGAKQILEKSVTRYLAAIAGTARPRGE